MCMQRTAKKLLVLFSIAICCLSLTGCPGFSDWDYQLPNGYAVWHTNSYDIALVKETSDDGTTAETVVDRFVVEFSHNESFIGIKRFPLLPSSEDDPNEEAFFENSSKQGYYNFVEEDLEYYLVDTFKEEIYGPYTSAEYATQCQEHQVGEMSAWISTIQDPNIASKDST